MMYFAGLITGIVLCIFIVLISRRHQGNSESILHKSAERLEHFLPKAKAEFFEPDGEVQDAIADVILENEKKGRGTKLEEIE